MTSRRDFLQAGLTGAAFLAVPAISTSIDSHRRFYKAIFDQRFPEGVAFARDMRRRGVPTHAISGDVTALWYQDLHFAWANAPIEVVGMTTASALFCLETLARDARHRVTSRHTLDGGLVSWTIGPRKLTYG
ncbi:MAG TPA: hypothetical protein VFB85_23840 [Vicinamibacterales bacterium]|nr:hypothetical protein [Vicinamibacterales bacterium]